jgi:hypothetical protein
VTIRPELPGGSSKPKPWFYLHEGEEGWLHPCRNKVKRQLRDWTYVILGLLLLCWAVCPIGVWSDSWQLHDGSEEVTATMPGCKLDRAGQGR